MSLAARDLDFGFPGRALGRGLTLALAAGESACLLGPNGSGKTTLMRTLLGLVAPLGGSVQLDGRAIEAWRPRERARRLAYVPQASESFFDFTLLETVELGRTAHRGAFSQPGRADRERALQALARVGLERLAARPIHRVSGGERRLALIARALATEAGTILMDEPTANLDFGNQARVLGEIARLAASGTTVLFSSHHPDHALRIAARALLLRDGRIVADGPPERVIDSESLTALYGRPVGVGSVALPGGRSVRACVALDGPPLA